MSNVTRPDFTVLIPARMASSRLPNKPLADVCGVPMIVRVARQAQKSQAKQVVVAADDTRIVQVCAQHGIQALLTRQNHPSGSDRLAEACQQLGLSSNELVVNVQGDEPLIDPDLINHVAQALAANAHASMSTAAHAITTVEDFNNPNVVKVVTDAHQIALYFSRAPIPWWRDGPTDPLHRQLPHPAPLRHVGIYAYRASFLTLFPQLSPAPMETMESLEQLRALWHGHKIAVHISEQAPGPGVDTPEDLERVRALLSA